MDPFPALRDSVEKMTEGAPRTIGVSISKVDSVDPPDDSAVAQWQWHRKTDAGWGPWINADSREEAYAVISAPGNQGRCEVRALYAESPLIRPQRQGDGSSSTLPPCPCGAACDGKPYLIGHELYRMDCIEADCGWAVIAFSAAQAQIDWRRRAGDAVAAGWRRLTKADRPPGDRQVALVWEGEVHGGRTSMSSEEGDEGLHIFSRSAGMTWNVDLDDQLPDFYCVVPPTAGADSLKHTEESNEATQ